MRMKFRCKNCGKMIFLHERLTRNIVTFMEARQEMYKSMWNKDFDGDKYCGLVKILSANSKCCSMSEIQMIEFHGFE